MAQWAATRAAEPAFREGPAAQTIGIRMLNITELLSDAFVGRLRQGYELTYGGKDPEIADSIASAAKAAVSHIANSDALYHNVEHTVHVTLVGQAILRGKHLQNGDVSSRDWLHVVISLLCHDIGYVKGICQADSGEFFASGNGVKRVRLPPGKTDASLMPYHVDRGKRYVDECFADHPAIDVECIKRNIELTRFPIPDSKDPPNTGDYPGLVRAADLIGQLGDPRYLKKIPALFYELEETGFNKTMGYENPGDLLTHYPDFYWTSVYPYIPDALRYLSVTPEGEEITANLYANLSLAERQIPS